ncbi:16750_t:CDS:2, partial [Acaulospora colombiana]
MSALHLDVTGDDSPEKLKNENHSEDDADSDFDDGGSQKRRPRIQRAEDFDDGHTEEASNVPAKNAWELSPPKEAEVDPWAEPSTEPAKFKTDVAKANGSEEQDLWGQEPKRGSGARARGDADTGTETNNKGKALGETQNTEVLSTEQSKASPREEQETKSREPKNKGPRSSKPPPPKKQEQTTNTDTTDAWALPPISTTEQDAGWGVTTSDDAQGATSGGWGDTPASAGWGDSPASEKPNSPKTFKRPPMYLNPDRVKTGGSERAKLSEEELAQRMEKIRLQNERIKEKRL